MKKIIVAVIIVGLGGLYIFSRSPADTTAPAVTTTTGQTSAGSESTNPAAGGTPPSTTPTATPAKTGYKDGVYTGAVTDATYGQVQVKTTVKGGLITDVTFLKYPDSRGHTSELSARVMPILTQEAIKAQSAKVDIISGATQTVEAFQQSLADSLAQAQA